MNVDLTKAEITLLGYLLQKADPMGIFTQDLFRKFAQVVNDSKGDDSKGDAA